MKETVFIYSSFMGLDVFHTCGDPNENLVWKQCSSKLNSWIHSPVNHGDFSPQGTGLSLKRPFLPIARDSLPDKGVMCGIQGHLPAVAESCAVWEAFLLSV